MATLLAASAHAEIPQGFSVFGTAAFVGSSVEGTADNSAFNGFGTDDTSFDVGAEYSFGSEGNFALGAKYLSGFDFFSSTEGGATTTVEDDGGYAVYLSPRLAIGDSTLFTVTLGMFESDGVLANDDGSATTELEGNYYGFGIRHYINGNNFVEVGMERFDYDSVTIDTLTLNGSATKALLSYGITF